MRRRRFQSVLRLPPLLAPVLAICLIMVHFGPPAHARQITDLFQKQPDRITFDAAIGWADRSISDMWTPVRLVIRGEDTPQAGLAMCEFTQGLRTHHRALMPFVTTPDADTVVDLAVLFTGTDLRWGDPRELTIRLIDENGKQLARRTFSTRPSGAEMPLGLFVEPSSGIFISIGDTSILQAAATLSTLPLIAGANQLDPEAVRAVLDEDFDRSAAEIVAQQVTKNRPGANVDEQSRVLSDAFVGEHEADTLPSLAGPYDALTALILAGPAIDDVPDRAHGAILQWLRSGGLLILIPDRPGRNLARWLDDPSVERNLRDLVEASSGTAAPHAEPPDVTVVGASTLRPPFTLSIPQPKIELEASETEDSPGSEAEAPDPESVTVDSTETDAPAETEPLNIQMPARAITTVGLGRAVILHADPSDLNLDAQAIARGWDISLAELCSHDVSDVGTGHPWGGDNTVDQANLVLADAVTNPFLSHIFIVFPYWLFAIFVLLLGCVLTFFDRLVLKRFRLSHWAWLTAVGWITLFSLIAWGAPEILRGRGTNSTRFEVFDVVPSKNVAFVSGLTALVSGRTGPLTLDASEHDSWWRPYFVPVFGQSEHSRFTLTSNFMRRGVPEPVQMPIWTYSLWQDEAPVQTSISASASQSSDQVEFTIRGIPESCSITSAAALTDSSAHPLSVIRNADGTLTATIDPALAAVRSDWMRMHARARFRRYGELRDTFSQSSLSSSMFALSLGRAANRGAAFDHLTSIPGKTLLVLDIEGSLSQRTIPRTSLIQSRTWLRILCDAAAQEPKQ